jgi:hypothetical protein
MFGKLLSARSVLIVLLMGGLVATGGYAWAQTTTTQPAKVVACTSNKMLFLADPATQQCPTGQTRVELVTSAYQDPDVADLKSRVAALETTVAALENKLSKVSYDATGLNGHPTLKIDGANLQIVDGSGDTEGTVNGRGNVFIGYNENQIPNSNNQTGSHNLVLGAQQWFYSYGGLIAGYANTLNAPYASVSGGRGNIADDESSSVSGGSQNRATSFSSSVSGGRFNSADGPYSSILGGEGIKVTTSYGTSP